MNREPGGGLRTSSRLLSRIDLGWLRPLLVFVGGPILLLVLITFHVIQGQMDLAPATVWEAV
ncbi:MAG: hypothetical protein ACOY93_22450, partial [Bacillota bacterium]